jgi:hypothetical protein
MFTEAYFVCNIGIEGAFTMGNIKSWSWLFTSSAYASNFTEFHFHDSCSRRRVRFLQISSHFPVNDVFRRCIRLTFRTLREMFSWLWLGFNLHQKEQTLPPTTSLHITRLCLRLNSYSTAQNTTYLTFYQACVTYDYRWKFLAHNLLV